MGLILVLGIAGVSPQVHDHLCAHDHSATTVDHCVIHSFAAGEAYSPPVIIDGAPISISSTPSAPRVECLLVLPAIAYRLLPACGPPDAGISC